jgi:hypothetical protein
MEFVVKVSAYIDTVLMNLATVVMLHKQEDKTNLIEFYK